MPIEESLLKYENNNHIVNKMEKSSINMYSNSNANTPHYMEKTGPLNPSISKNDSSVICKQHQAHVYFKGHHVPAKYINSKRNRPKFNSMYAQMYPDHNNYLHLNSLWSIWYGVLFTLFQGYLAAHGASRFLGCSLISWKIEPVSELNLQIILSGLVFILLPIFFTSAVFKVGNMANDGIKLGSTSKERFCSMVFYDRLEQESRCGTLRNLWTHGGPTAAFIHILIAMCLLLPRLLLEARIIENGLLPKETIWRTELDFVTVNQRNLLVLSLKNFQNQNSTPIEIQEDVNNFNDINFTTHSRNDENTKNFSNSNIKQNEYRKIMGNRKVQYLELLHLVADTIKENINTSNRLAVQITTLSPTFTSTFIYDDTNTITTNASPKENRVSAILDKNNLTTSINEFIGTKTNTDFLFNHSIKKHSKDNGNISESGSLPSLERKHISYNTYLENQKHSEQNDHYGKAIRKHHRRRKITSPLSQRKNNEQYSPAKKFMKSSSERLKDLHQLNNKYSDRPIGLTNLDEFHLPVTREVFKGAKVYEHRPTSYEVLDYVNARGGIYPKSSTTTSNSLRDSNIHIVKTEKLPDVILSTPLSSNSEIIEIKQKPNKKIKRDIIQTEVNHVKIEAEYVVDEFSVNDSSEINLIESSATSGSQSDFSPYNIGRLDGFAGMLQLFFGVEKPIDVSVFMNPPSPEFVNMVCALFVWCVRYPAVFWTTAKSFAAIFSVQMIASSADIIFTFVGVSSLLKLQIYSQGQPTTNSGLVLNASVTLALFLLSVILILSSSMILYLYGYGRLSAKARDRSIISLNSNESWTCFSHCASLCYALALSVVKAPLLNDLSSTYRSNLHCPTFIAALVSVMHILLWIIVWMGLAVKRKWSFKLPPLDAYAIVGKTTTQPIPLHNRRSIGNINTVSVNTSAANCLSSSFANENSESKIRSGNSRDLVSNASSSDVLNAPTEDIYWPKIAPGSPKLDATLNEMMSTSDDDHQRHVIGDLKENDAKRSPHNSNQLCLSRVEGEIDDGDYATLRSGATTIVGITSGSSSGSLYKHHSLTGGVKVLHIREFGELPPPPSNMASSMTITKHTTTVTVNPQNAYENCLDECVEKMFGYDNILEEGKLLDSVGDDAVTYASSYDFDPPLPPPPPQKFVTTTNNNSVSILRSKNISEFTQLSSADYLVSPLAPVRVPVHTNETHIAQSSTPRCVRRADSGVPQEALTPRSDTNSCGTESTSPPERALSESSSGVHSAEEREIEVIIRPRIASKPISKLPPAIQEEPNGRCTNMRMLSFAKGCSINSATLPLLRPNADEKFDYSLHCSTMPLQMNGQSHKEEQTKHTSYTTSDHCISNTQSTVNNMSSFKTPLYANSGVDILDLKQSKLHNDGVQTRYQIPTTQQVTHTTLSNGIRYSKPNILRRHSSIKITDSQYNHQPISKIQFENSLANSAILEDRDSANYSMVSDQEILFVPSTVLH